MREARILYKEEEAGVLIQHDEGIFTFQYHDTWIQAGKPAISLTLPVTQQVYQADHLFPFFYNMLPEGSNKHIVCRHYRIDHDDYFGILLATAQNDNIGAVKVIKVETL